MPEFPSAAPPGDPIFHRSELNAGVDATIFPEHSEEAKKLLDEQVVPNT